MWRRRAWTCDDQAPCCSGPRPLTPSTAISIDLEAYGLTTDRRTAFDASAPDGAVVARVTTEYQHHLELITAEGTVLAHMTGRLRHRCPTRIDQPAAGDWVVVDLHDDDGPGVIDVLPRSSRIVRQAAGRRTEPQVVGANLDTVFVVTSLNRDFNPRRLERYLAVAWEGDAVPVVVLNKADLCDDVEARAAEARSVAAGAPVVALSALDGHGVDALEPWLGRGRTVGLVGSSGVGKSTLANALIGDEVQDTGAIREADDRGRHTTTRRQLLLLPDDRGVLLDTPGMRELGMWGGEDGLRRAFADIEELAVACRFRDCSHDAEPGCAVRAAIESGTLDAARVSSFRALLAEAAESVERARVAEARRVRVASGRHRRPRRR